MSGRGGGNVEVSGLARRPRHPGRGVWLTVGAWVAGGAALVGAVTLIVLLRADAVRWGLGRDLLLARLVPALAGLGLVLGAFAAGDALLVRRARRVGPAAGALVVSAAALAVALLAAAKPSVRAPGGGLYPPVHDVATDWRDPLLPSPALVRLRGPDAWPVEAGPLLPEGPGGGFLGRTVAEMNLRFCPAAQPLVLPLRPADAYARVHGVLTRAGLGVVTDDPAAGRLEAVALRGVLAAREDVIVRVRPDGAGARIDLRSIARHGLNDGGSDCARVTRLRAVLARGV